MSSAGRAWLRAAIAAAVLVLGWLLRAVTVPLLAAYLLCLLLLPLKERLQPRLGRTGAVLLCLLLLVVLPLLLALPVLGDLDEFAELLPTAESARAFAERLQVRLVEAQERLPESAAGLLRFEPEQLQELGRALAGRLAGLAAAVADFLGGFFGILGVVVLLPIFTFFLLQGAPWEPRIRAELPPEWRRRYDRVAPRILEVLRRYARARVLVAGCKGLIWYGMLLVGGIPCAYSLALLAGLLSLLPVFGPLVAFLAVVLVAGLDAGLAGLIFAVAAYAVAEAVEGWILLPRLVGRGLGLGDFAVVLAVMAGGALGGIFGMLVAIPLTAVARVLYDEFARPVMGTA
ncbi:MAG: AI-2E family transporter [Planctomycetota bacterium]|nr:MAG: AI-2E family transporter [Planctomycetota bacterium]